ncbi:hypothetical protein ABPG72_011489 [Tetrahymena utriculariae]
MNKPNQRQFKDNVDYVIKILLVGDSAVGKTNIMLKYCEQGYKTAHMVTVGVDFKMKTIKVDQKQLKLIIWDTAGQEKYQAMAQSIYNGAQAVIVVYSITDRNSFMNVRNWIKQISEHVPDQIIITLVGNKCDESENQRKVDKAEGQALANEYKIPFFESSAKDNINITQLFEETARQIKEKILNNNNTAGDSAQKIKFDTLQVGSPSPQNNDNFKLTAEKSKQPEQIYAETTPFDAKIPQSQNSISNCQC